MSATCREEGEIGPVNPTMSLKFGIQRRLVLYVDASPAAVVEILPTVGQFGIGDESVAPYFFRSESVDGSLYY